MTMVGVMRMGFNELNCCGGEQRLRFCDVCGCCVGGQGAGVRLTRIGRQENRPQSCIPPSSTSKGSFHCPASSSVVPILRILRHFIFLFLLSLVQMVTRTKKIFVGGLSAPSTVDDVKGYFEQFGRVRKKLLSSF